MKAQTLDMFTDDKILDHATILRSLARALLRDEHRADDVVQETWLEVIKHPPKRGGDLSPWLKQIAKRLSFRTMRSDSRRRDREKIAASPEMEPTVPSSIERLEVLRELINALGELDAPYREVILARFFDGKPPRTIARELGVPVETVATRLRRGLERLRARLDRLRDRDSWRAVLLPLMGVPQLSAAAALLLSWTAIKIAAALLIVAIPIILITNASSNSVHSPDPMLSDEPSVTEDEHETTAVTQGVAPIVAGIRSAIDPPNIESEGSPSIMVVGRVVREDGEVLSGATVLVARRLVSETDTEGRYELELPGDYKNVYIRAHAPGYALKTRDFGGCRAGDQIECDFVLPHEIRFRGRITDEQGFGVAGAVVMTTIEGPTIGHDVQSGHDGSYELTNLDPSITRFLVKVEAEGFLKSHSYVMPTGEISNVDVVLDRGATIHGVVHDSDGRPVGGAFVIYGHGELDTDHIKTVADENGVFSLDTVPRNASCPFFVEARGYAPFLDRFIVESDLHDLSVTLSVGSDLDGVVRSVSGEPIEGASIDVGTDSFPFRFLSTTSDEDGDFRIEHAPSPPFDLHVRKEGSVEETRRVEELTESLEIVLTPKQTSWIAGTVVDAVSGEPIREFSIKASKGPFLPSWRDTRFQREDGGWELGPENVPSGTECAIRISSNGFAPLVLDSILTTQEPDPQSVTVRLTKGVSIVGRILSLGDSRPVVGARVMLVDPERVLDHLDGFATPYEPRTTGEDGGFRFDHVANEPLCLLVEPIEGARVVQGPVEWSGDSPPLPINVFVSAGSRIEGTAFDRSGVPAASARVWLRVSKIGGFHSDRRLADIQTDDDGHFTLDELPLGRHEVTVYQENSRDQFMRFVEFTDDETRSLTFGGLDGSAGIDLEILSDRALPPDLICELTASKEESSRDWENQLFRWRFPVDMNTVRIDRLPAAFYRLRLEWTASNGRWQDKWERPRHLEDGRRENVILRIE